MPDDRDADVGPAADREDLFRPASSREDLFRPASSTDPRTPEGRDVPEAPSGRSDDSHGSLFPTPEGGSSDVSATRDHRAHRAEAAEAPGRDDDPGDSEPSGTSPPSGTSTPSGTSDAGASKAARSTSSFFRELPVLLLVAFLLAFLLRTFVLQVFFIPSGSMEPTLQVDDRMVVEKITYLFREPVRGEIVVFEGESFGTVDPEATAGERIVRGLGQFLGVVPASARDYVKRVIGLPGDEIVIEDGEVRVNGQLLDEPYVVFEDPTDFGPVTVPQGHLFFLGDNRPNSSDSRRGLGFVPTDAVVGRSAVIIWPFENLGLLTDVEHELGPASGPAEVSEPTEPTEPTEPSEPIESDDEAA